MLYKQIYLTKLLHNFLKNNLFSVYYIIFSNIIIVIDTKFKTQFQFVPEKENGKTD